MKLNLSWWKLLGIVLTIYVLVAGFKVPLQPGILSNSNSKANSGETFTTVLTTYNTYLTLTEDLNAWIWLPNDKLIKADRVRIENDTRLEATFNIPTDLGIATNKGIMCSIILDSETEGHYFMRTAVSIDNRNSGNDIKGVYYELDVIKSVKRFAIPFQHILYETNRNTFFHVAIWMAMFAILIVSCYNSIMYLLKLQEKYDRRSSSLTTVAIVFGIAGLLTGSMWAKYTWGAFWTTDIKLNMTAIAMLIYLGYWILRGSITDLDARARVSSVFNLFAFVCLMVLVMVIPRLTDSLHPGNGGNPAFSSYDLDNTMRLIFYPAILAYFIIGMWMAELNYRFMTVKENLKFGN